MSDLQRAKKLARCRMVKDLTKISQEIMREAVRARDRYSPYNSLHEAYAVLKEEIEEFWTEVKKRPNNRFKKSIRKEVIQIGAVSMLILMDLLDGDQSP